MHTARSHFFFGKPGNAAEGAGDILGVAAGEGIACCLFPCAFHDGEVGILYPGSRNAEHQLQKLIEQRAHKAGGEQIVAVFLAEAPENGNGNSHKDHFPTAEGNGSHNEIQHGISDAFNGVQKFQKIILPFKNCNQYTILSLP